MSACLRLLRGLILLLVASCVTARPDLEFRFGPDKASHDRWAQLQVTRYGCDTTVTRPTYGMGYATLNPGSVMPGTPVCEVLRAAPTEVLVWRTRVGLREEWHFDAPGRWTLFWEGAHERGLRVTGSSEPTPQQSGGRRNI